MAFKPLTIYTVTYLPYRMFLTAIFKEKTNDNEKGAIIAFRNKPKTPSKDLKRFCNQLYGYKDHSQKGNYLYKRKGLLDKIPHILINPIRSVVIIKKKDAEQVLNFLKEFDVEIYVKDIKLEEEDIKKLETASYEHD